MSRFKTFEATGVAPDGRLYAGDLNAIQDRFADLQNFGQTVDLQTLRLGEVSLQLLFFGTSEARLTGAFRTDGITRGLGGFVAGAFTNAQRTAIAVGFAPKGIMIYNTDVNEVQVNVGTDGARVWKRFEVGDPGAGSDVAGFVGQYSFAAHNLSGPGEQIPVPGWLYCNGAAISRTTYSALFAITGTAHGAGNGSTTFNLPNFSDGRFPLSQGGGFVRGQRAGAVNHTLVTAEMPVHAHTMQGNTPEHAHNAGGSAINVPPGPWFFMASGGETFGVAAGGNPLVVAGILRQWTSNVIDAHTHTINNQGSGQSHNNMPPYEGVGGILVKF